MVDQNLNENEGRKKNFMHKMWDILSSIILSPLTVFSVGIVVCALNLREKEQNQYFMKVIKNVAINSAEAGYIIGGVKKLVDIVKPDLVPTIQHYFLANAFNGDL